MKTTFLLLILTSLHVLADDPSLKAQPDPTGKAKYAERQRILTDLDADGDDDMLLSGSPDEFGNMGGPWTVYLSRKGEYVRIGEVWAHPMAIAIEPDQAKIYNDLTMRRFARIWVYLRAGGSAGTFGYYRVGEESVDDIKSIEIYPGDGGTDTGRAIYDAAFKQSVIPFTVQRSTTAENGTVTWPDKKIANKSEQATPRKPSD
jgi:hypothetical protein